MAELYDGYEVSQDKVREFAIAELGELTADYCANIAKLDDFAEFKKACENLGERIVTAPGGPKYKPSSDGSEVPVVLNTILIMRYPFLAGFGGGLRFGSESDSEDAKKRYEEGRFSYTELNSVLNGWRARFGLDMCEDIRDILRSAPEPTKAFSCYHVDQVKEKYASLRWYDGGIMTEIAEPLHDLNYLYESLSEATCDTCGSWNDVRQDRGGYIASVCMRCRSSAMKDVGRNAYGKSASDMENDISEMAKEHGYDEKYIAWGVRDAIFQAKVAESTSGISDMLADSVIIKRYGLDGDSQYNAYERLRLAYPKLNIVRLVEQHDLYVQAHPALTQETAGAAIDEAIAKDKKEREERAKKFGA